VAGLTLNSNHLHLGQDFSKKTSKSCVSYFHYGSQNILCLGLLRCGIVEIPSDKKPSDTWRSGELRFYFAPEGPDGFTYCV
jgi:hypothetical protein